MARERSTNIDVVVSDVVKHEALGSSTFVFSKPDGSAMPSFRAGQYISVKLNINGSCISRPYSICSSPKDAFDGRYAITVQSNPGGFAADWMIENFKKGTRLVISSPVGNFYPGKKAVYKNIVAIAGGSGITPFLSMARAIWDHLEDFNLTILYGNSDEKNILFKDELDDICKKTDKVKVVYVLSDEKKKGFEYGFVSASIVKKYASGNYCILACGPESMYRFLEENLKELNIPKRYIRFEMRGVTRNAETHRDYPVDSKGKEYNIKLKLDSEEYNIKASAGEPVLVAAERAGIKVPSRCRCGVCAWCRSKVLSGTFFVPKENDHRSKFEILGKRIHPCATFPTSDMVISVSNLDTLTENEK